MLPLRLTIFRSDRAIARWKVADALHRPNGIRRHAKSPSWQKALGLVAIRLSHRNLPKGPGEVYTGIDFGVTQPRQALVDAGQGVGVLNGHLIQRAEVAAKAQLPVFLPLRCHLPKGTARAVSFPRLAGFAPLGWHAQPFQGTSYVHLHDVVQPQALALPCV